MTRLSPASIVGATSDDRDSAVFPHGDLTQVASNLWWVKSEQAACWACLASCG